MRPVLVAPQFAADQLELPAGRFKAKVATQLTGADFVFSKHFSSPKVVALVMRFRSEPYEGTRTVRTGCRLSAT